MKGAEYCRFQIDATVNIYRLKVNLLCALYLQEMSICTLISCVQTGTVLVEEKCYLC